MAQDGKAAAPFPVFNRWNDCTPVSGSDARAKTMSVRQSEFIPAATMTGTTNRKLIVAATFGVALNILLDATLSILGLGAQEPAPSWGNMLYAARAVDVIDRMPWL